MKNPLFLKDIDTTLDWFLWLMSFGIVGIESIHFSRPIKKPAVKLFSKLIYTKTTYTVQ